MTKIKVNDVLGTLVVKLRGLETKNHFKIKITTE